MRYYGIDCLGEFKIQSYTNLPVWVPTDERRIIYIVHDKSLYFGTNTGWSKSNTNTVVSDVNPLHTDSGYDLGTVWINTVLELFFVCVQNDVNNAIWFNPSLAKGKTIRVNSNYVSPGEVTLLADSSDASFTISLPLSASEGTKIKIIDAESTFKIHPITVDASTYTLMSTSGSTLELDIDRMSAEFIFDSVMGNWTVDFSGSALFTHNQIFRTYTILPTSNGQTIFNIPTTINLSSDGFSLFIDGVYQEKDYSYFLSEPNRIIFSEGLSTKNRIVIIIGSVLQTP